MVSRSRKCLPADMLTEVLCRLPVESLLRCMFVCKTWHQIISSTFFVKTHLEYQKTSSNTNKYILHDQTRSYTLLTDYESIFYGTKHSKLYYTPQSFVSDVKRSDRGLRIYGICDGLLCVSDNGFLIGANIYLWNPICRKVKILPKFKISIKEGTKFMANGVSFGHYVDDYKVIVISPVDHTYIVSVYSLSTNCWKIIHSNINFEDKAVGFLPLQPTKFVDGNAYMITYDNKVLVCFDLRDGTIRQFKLPEELVAFEVTMEAYGETIAVLGSGKLSSQYLYMWILRDKLSSTSPWERKLVIELQEVGFTYGVGFLSNGKYLISSMIYEGELPITKFFTCDFQSPKLTEFRSIDGYSGFLSHIESNCVESLLLHDENSLDPFVWMDVESFCSSTLFTLYNRYQDIPVKPQFGKKVGINI